MTAPDSATTPEKASRMRTPREVAIEWGDYDSGDFIAALVDEIRAEFAKEAAAQIRKTRDSVSGAVHGGVPFEIAADIVEALAGQEWQPNKSYDFGNTVYPRQEQPRAFTEKESIKHRAAIASMTEPQACKHPARHGYSDGSSYCLADLCGMCFSPTISGPELCAVCRAVAHGQRICRGMCDPGDCPTQMCAPAACKHERTRGRMSGILSKCHLCGEP